MRYKETELGKIPIDWNMEILENISKRVKVGFVGSCNSFYCDKKDGIPMIRTTNLTKGKINMNDLKYITKEFYEKNKKSQLNFGDILIARHGNNGMASLWDKSIKAQCLNVVIVETDENKVDPIYLTYSINSPIVNNQVLSRTGGSVQEVINTKTLAKLLIPYPELKKQKRIVRILKSLDDKIELNNEMNKTLEEMAQTLFKRWFIDFDFPNENGEPYRSSGGKMVDSELGEIPEGWEIKELDEITAKFATGLNPRKNFVLGEGENFYVTIKNMNNNNVILDDKCDKITFDALQKINKRSNLKIGDILFSGIGTIGKVFYIDKEPQNWNISESIFTIRANSFITSEFLYLLALSKPFQEYSLSLASGSVQKGIRMGDLKRYKKALPKIEVILKFSESISKIIGNIKNNQEEIQSLTEIRDTLLPKLMSGEIEV